MLPQNAWYFINALVRANYTNIEKGILETTRYIELFLENLLFNGNNDLKIDIYILDGIKKWTLIRKKWTLIRKKWTLKILKSLKQ